MLSQLRAKAHIVLLLLVMAAGTYFRASGLFRGLDRNVVYHPDSPKQVLMLHSYLQGKYVQYQDNLFYDGYPYGLNRIDELLIRGVQAITLPFEVFVFPGDVAVRAPNRSELFYWGRVLRVFYGSAAILLVYLAVRKFGRSRWAAMAAAALYALAPLGSTVTHCVTGDVGVDLFVAAGLLCMAAYWSSGGLFPLLVFGLAAGVAFSCKFQGLLIMWAPGLALLLTMKREWKAAPARAGVLLAGFAAGLIVANPALLIDASKTWKNMRLNFVFIRDYGVSSEFLDRPLIEKAAFGLTRNLPAMTACLGWTLAALTVLALMCATTRWLSDRTRRNAIELAVVSFTPVALLLSTALKPAVQPFHFSFLLPAMAVSAGLLIGGLPGRAFRIARPLLAVLVIAAILEASAAAIREDFFWRRGETIGSGEEFSKLVFTEPRPVVRNVLRRDVVKQFYTEPAVLPVFRNRRSAVVAGDAGRWNDAHQLPAPPVPMPWSSTWIHMNGPVFPRSDRMIEVNTKGGRPKRRTLVYNTEPTEISLGLRTGKWPARYEVSVPGCRKHGFIPAHSQVRIDLTAVRPALHFPATAKGPEVFLVPLSIASDVGTIWATILDGARETAIFELFGPNPGAVTNVDELLSAWNEVGEMLSATRYLDGSEPFEIDTKRTALTGETSPLAGGAYVFTARVLNPGAAQKLRFELLDDAGLAHVAQPDEIQIESGWQDVTWRFEKEFAPYDAVAYLTAEQPGMFVQSWRLGPDPERLPDWIRRSAASHAVPPQVEKRTVTTIKFPGIGNVTDIVFPEVLSSGREFEYAVKLDLDENIRSDVFHEAVFFMHLKDPNGNVAAMLDFPLRNAGVNGGLVGRQRARLDLAERGNYRLEGGIYNVRTRLRFSFECPQELAVDKKRRVLLWKEVTVE